MAARRPFWKWHRWKSIGFCLWAPSTCIWNLKLKFQSKLDLCSGNHVAYRQTDRRTDGRTDGQGESSIPPPPPQLRLAGVQISVVVLSLKCSLFFAIRYLYYVLLQIIKSTLVDQTEGTKTTENKYNNWCKASKLIAPALTTIWSQIFKMGSWKKNSNAKLLIVLLVFYYFHNYHFDQ